MENATKALLIAAGVLLGLMIISVCIFMYSQISAYYESKAANRINAELATFNSQYLVYQKNNLRGSDLLSLINRILDFNISKGDEDTEIEISIKIGNSTKAKEIYYQPDNYSVKLINIGQIYTEDNIGNVLDEVNRIERKYTKEKVEKLTSKIDAYFTSAESKQNLLNSLKITNAVDNDILKYYQYQQFKRARFNCKIVQYTETKRVQKFEVEFINKFE